MKAKSRNHPFHQIAAGAVLAGIALLLFLPQLHPPKGRWSDALWNVLHVPTFFVVTLCLSYLVSSKFSRGGRILYATAGAAVLAIASEFIQELTGRSGSLQDFFFDSSGIALAGIKLGFLHRSTSSQIIPYGLLCLSTIVACLWPAWGLDLAEYRHRTRLPDIGAFSSPESLLLWRAQGNASISSAEDGDGLKVHIGPGEYGGVSYRPGIQDWSAFSVLNLQVVNPGDSFLMGVRMDNLGPDRRAGRLRYTSEVLIASGTSEVTVFLNFSQEAGSSGNARFTRLTRLALFTLKESGEREFVINSALLK